MQHQADKPIDEIFPGMRLASETPLQKLAIDVGQCHARTSKKLVEKPGYLANAKHRRRKRQEAASKCRFLRHTSQFAVFYVDARPETSATMNLVGFADG
jgi:hypothetical protein